MRMGWLMEFLPLGAIRPLSLSGAGCAITHAECTGVSGPGYYAAGPRLDVQDVPRQVAAVLYVLRARPSGHMTFRVMGERG